MNRTFVLPLVSGLAMTTSACSSSAKLEGLWSITVWDYDGEVYNLPNVYTYEEDGVTYTSVEGLRLDVRGEGRASFGYYYSYGSSDGYYELYDDGFYGGTWEKGKGRSFDFEFDDADLDMNCTLDGDALSCEGDYDGFDLFMEAERLDDE